MSHRKVSKEGGQPVHYHFSAICGTAMASLAVLMKKRGYKVTGSDENCYPPMTDLLAENEIEITSPFSENNLRPHPDFIVLGNALSRGNTEVEYALNQRLHYLSMAELLKEQFIRGNKSVVITGTHGKTTTTSLAAHVLSECGKPTGFMIGGVAENFKASSRDVTPGGYFVIEGDEYDTSLFDKRSKFFHYLPDRLIINNIEFDHADIFKDIEEIKRSFSLMLRHVPQDGLIIVNGDDPNAVAVVKTGFTPYVTFGMSDTNDATIHDITSKKNSVGMEFKLNYQNQNYNVSLPLFGEHNIKNAVAVILLALNENIPIENIQQALNSFKNVRRRLQLLTTNQQIRVFDDFAHHPTAISETIKAIRQSWPSARIHAVYEARSNTSVRNIHQERMADAFAEADSVIFYKIYRQERIPAAERLDLEQIAIELTQNGIPATTIEDLNCIVGRCLEISKPDDIFLFMSNGAFGGIQQQLSKQLDERWIPQKN